MALRVFRASAAPTADDVRELKAFLEGSRASDEKSLQRLLERHPFLVGILGFSDFISEVPIYKVDENNEPELLNLHRRDRADLIAAKHLQYFQAIVRRTSLNCKPPYSLRQR